MVGQTISHYHIIEKLGEGGMGVVYKAEDTKLDRLVALKFLPPQLSASEQDKARFIHEAKATSALDHPNICTIYEVDETPDGQLFIAMACYEGETLQQKIAKGPLPLDDAITYAIQIAEGLQAAHKKGITHRDIKSSNIMVTPEGQVKIMDFGLAKTTGATMLTKSGATVGTVPYMSPEQARGEKVDHRTDIWSLGVVLYEMISGRLPFQSTYSEAIVYSILNEEPKALTALRSDVPMELERIVRKAMQKDRGMRYQRIEELIVDLRAARKETESGISKTKPATERTRKRNRWVVTGGAAAGILVILIAGYLLLSREPMPAEKNSIAVLPFQNFSEARDDEYFSDGMTESIITDLARIRALLVIARNSVFQYKGKNVDVKKVGQELNVGYVLEGSVQRSANRLRLNVQLIDVTSGYHVWADRYDRDLKEVFALQDDISKNIVAALKLRVGSGTENASQNRPTQNLEAYDLYLRGSYYLKKQSVKEVDQAVELLEQTVRTDPSFAAALASLGMAYIQKSFYDEPLKKTWEEKASVAIGKALAIDPNLAEAYVAKGNLLWTPANRFPHEQAIAAYRHAIELNPNLVEAHEWLALVYYHIGLFDMGIAECRKALQINPSSAFAQSRLGINLLYAGRYEEALTELRKVPEGFSPQIVPTQIAITLSYLGRMREAETTLEEAYKQLPDDPFVLSAQALFFALTGKADEAMQKIQVAEGKEKTYLGHFHHAAYNLGSAYALMKNNAKAVLWLQKAADDGFPCYPKFENDPYLNNLRSDPQFISLMVKLKKQGERYKQAL
jgi:serine/threonine protein kinase/tetratricopeptide (TPR) repeat protein